MKQILSLLLWVWRNEWIILYPTVGKGFSTHYAIPVYLNKKPNLMTSLSQHSEASFQFNGRANKQFLKHVIGAPRYVIGGAKPFGADHRPQGTLAGGGWSPLEQADATADDGGPHLKDFPYNGPHYKEHYSGIVYLFGSKSKSTTTPTSVDYDDSSDIDDSWIL